MIDELLDYPVSAAIQSKTQGILVMVVFHNKTSVLKGFSETDVEEESKITIVLTHVWWVVGEHGNGGIIFVISLSQPFCLWTTLISATKDSCCNTPFH